VRELAVLRDIRDLRTPGTPPDGRDTGTRILVAAPTDPTLTWWTFITGDLNDSRRHLAAVTATQDTGIHDTGATGPAGAVLIVEAHGYGQYGQHRPVLDLAVLCAIDQVADRSGLPASAVGDWLHAQGATTADPTAEQITAVFGDAYAGVFATRRDFAAAERDRRGWTATLTAAAIPLPLFDLDALVTQLFRDVVCEVQLADGAVAVFRRHTTETADARPNSRTVVVPVIVLVDDADYTAAFGDLEDLEEYTAETVRAAAKRQMDVQGWGQVQVPEAEAGS
jgi:hypothetical protein